MTKCPYLKPWNITSNAANKKSDQCPSTFRTGISAAAHATLEIEQLTFDIRTAIVDTVTSLQGSDREDIKVSEEQDVLNKIHDILDGFFCISW